MPSYFKSKCGFLLFNTIYQIFAADSSSSFDYLRLEAVEMLPPVTIIETLVAGEVPSSLVLRWSWEELSLPPAFVPTTAILSARAQIAAQLLGERPEPLSGTEKFWSLFEDFLVHRVLAGNVVSIKWDVNFHEYFLMIVACGH